MRFLSAWLACDLLPRSNSSDHLHAEGERGLAGNVKYCHTVLQSWSRESVKFLTAHNNKWTTTIEKKGEARESNFETENTSNYWNGWLLHNEGNRCILKHFQGIRLTNIDTGEVILHHVKHLDFEIAKHKSLDDFIQDASDDVRLLQLGNPLRRNTVLGFSRVQAISFLALPPFDRKRFYLLNWAVYFYREHTTVDSFIILKNTILSHQHEWNKAINTEILQIIIRNCFN